MRITVLGSGSPEAHARRASSGYLIEIGDDRILFDCGGGAVSRLIEAGHRPVEISHIVFSHLHSDHMMDYARLVHGAWDEGGAPIQVYGPAPIAAITDKLFGSDGVFAHDLKARTGLKASQEVWRARGGTLPRPWPAPVVREVTPGFTIEGDGWTIRSTEAQHAQPFLMCMALSIEADGRRFVYSGDAAVTPEMEAFSQGADLLIHWCYRLDGEEPAAGRGDLMPSPSEIGAMAARAAVKRLLLTHFRVHMDAPEAYAGALAAVRGAAGPDAGIVEDLDVITL